MLGIIGGSGLETLSALASAEQRALSTPYGAPSAPPRLGHLHDVPVVFVPRHGERHDIPPHRVNYRANLWVLRELGARAVVAMGAVGAIAPWFLPGRLALPDQLIDYTWGRCQSFWDRPGEPMRHVEFTAPMDPELHEMLWTAGKTLPAAPAGRGVYGVTQGPRLETAAEIRRLRRDGCDMVGMTLMPEAALARELGLAYASVSYAANWAAGCTAEDLHGQAERWLHQGAAAAVTLLLASIAALGVRYG